MEVIRFQIEEGALEALSKAGGFHDPNDFKFSNVLQVLDTCQFPQRDCYEFQWAIYESGLEAIRSMPKWSKMFICALYLYCNKKHQWGMTVESDYFYLLVEEGLRTGGQYAAVAIQFLEWLQEHVAEDVGYDDYFLLLAWLLLSRSVTQPPPCIAFEQVVHALEVKAYTRQMIDEMSVSVARPLDWLALSDKLPCVCEVGADTWLQVICGL